jgi:hypothetical protein
MSFRVGAGSLYNAVDLQHNAVDLQHNAVDLQHNAVDLQHNAVDLQPTARPQNAAQPVGWCPEPIGNPDTSKVHSADRSSVERSQKLATLLSTLQNIRDTLGLSQGWFRDLLLDVDKIKLGEPDEVGRVEGWLQKAATLADELNLTPARAEVEALRGAIALKRGTVAEGWAFEWVGADEEHKILGNRDPRDMKEAKKLYAEAIDNYWKALGHFENADRFLRSEGKTIYDDRDLLGYSTLADRTSTAYALAWMSKIYRLYL